MSDTSDNKIDKVSIQEAARALSVDTRTIYRWINKGLLSKVKDGGKTYVSLTDVKILSDKSQTSQTQKLTDVGQAEIVSDICQKPVKSENNHCVIDRQHYEGLLIRLGQLEAEKRYLLEYKGGLEAKEQELSESKSKVSEQNKILREASNKIKELQAENKKLKLSWWRRIFQK